MGFKTTKLIIASVLMSIIFSVFTVGYILNEKKDIAGNILRLHIVGASNTAYDQRIKLYVRNRIIEDFSHLLSNSSSASDSAKTVAQNLKEIKLSAEDELRKRGCYYSVTANIEKCCFPTKRYGTVALPAGEYSALNIKIGPAIGQNWWCVMYPPLCITDTTVEMSEKSKEKLKSVLSCEEYRLISEAENTDIKFKFKIAEILGKYFK